MPANRLVFVSIKGKSTKRKVAVPVSGTMTYAEFADTVRRKLKLQAVGEMELAGGVPLTALEQLEDIAEVLVTEKVVGVPIQTTSGSGAPPSSPFNATLSPRSNANASTTNQSSVSAHNTQFESKYVKKQSDVALAMKRMQGLFGGAAAADSGSGSLPLTRKDTSTLTPIEQVKRRMKKRRRSVFDPRTLLALFSILSVGVVLVFVYLRISGGMAVVDSGVAVGRKELPG